MVMCHLIYTNSNMKHKRLRDLVGSETDLLAIQNLRVSLPLSEARNLDKILSILSDSDGPLSVADKRAISIALQPIVVSLASDSTRFEVKNLLSDNEKSN
jgi:hypothetical protein